MPALLRSRPGRRSRLRRLFRHLAGPVLPVPPLPGQALGQCRRCCARAVVPVCRREHGDGHWQIRLRCGECGSARDVVVSDEEARRLDRELDRGADEIAAVLRRLESAEILVAAADREGGARRSRRT